MGDVPPEIGKLCMKSDALELEWAFKYKKVLWNIKCHENFHSYPKILNFLLNNNYKFFNVTNNPHNQPSSLNLLVLFCENESNPPLNQTLPLKKSFAYLFF